jgi:hypothetical protein
LESRGVLRILKRLEKVFQLRVVMDSAQGFSSFPRSLIVVEVPPIHAERKPALNSDDPDQPVFLSREADREWR